MNNFETFKISQVGILIRDDKCLILEFSKSPGMWGLPGGRIDKGEGGEESFRREVKEEINFDDLEIFDIVDYDIFYPKLNLSMCAIVHYMKNDSEHVVLSHEHLSYAWIKKEEIENYSFYWKNMPRMLKKGFQYHKKLKNK